MLPARVVVAPCRPRPRRHRGGMAESASRVFLATLSQHSRTAFANTKLFTHKKTVGASLEDAETAHMSLKVVS